MMKLKDMVPDGLSVIGWYWQYQGRYILGEPVMHVILWMEYLHDMDTDNG